MSNRDIEYRIRLKDGMSQKLHKINGATKSTTKSFSGLNAVIGAVSVSAMVAFGKTAVETAAKYEGLNKAISFSSGNATQAALNLEFLRNTADNLGLSYEGLAGGFKTFSGAMRGSIFSASKQRDMFLKVSKATKVMQLDAESTKGVFLALGQVMSKGKVQAEELRGQIGERIPGAFSIAAKAMGVTSGELDKMMASGKLLAEDFLPKFADQLDKEFAGGVTAAKESITSDLNALSNAWDLALTKMGESVAKSGLIKTMANLISDVTKKITYKNDLEKFMQSFSTDTEKRLDQFSAKIGMMNLFGSQSQFSEKELFGLAEFQKIEKAKTVISELQEEYNALDDTQKMFFSLKKLDAYNKKLLALKDTYEDLKSTNAFGELSPEMRKLRSQIGVYEQLRKGVSSYDFAAIYKDSGGDAGDVLAKSEKELFGTTLTAASPKQFNINIENLIDDGVSINSTTIQDGAQDNANIVVNELVKGLAQLEQISQ